MIDFLKRLFLVRKCVVCRKVMLDDTREEVFCNECRAEYERLKALRCRICGREHRLCRCLPPRLFHDVAHAVHLIPYRDAFAHRLIYVLKRKNDRVTRRFLAGELVRAVRDAGVSTADCDVSFVPRLPKSIGYYGFDHSRTLARAFARMLGLPLKCLFRHKRRTPLQKNLTVWEREENARRSYHLRRRLPKERGRRLILVDDVVTSGCTMARLASLAKSVGYEEIIVVSLARAIFRRGRI